MQARSAVVDLYGDHLRTRGFWAPVAALVGLTSACGVQGPAARTAISRLVSQGWLVSSTVAGVRGYAATPTAQERLRHAYTRIYARRDAAWDGRWHVVVVDHDGDRARRERVAATLGYLGYGRLAPMTWVSPRHSDELVEALADIGAGCALTGTLAAADQAPQQLVERVWDVDALGAAYTAFARTVPDPVSASRLPPAQAYPVRTDLVHRWRKFLFRDPDLPAQALPHDWAGHEARARFHATSDALAPAARIFVDEALAAAGADSDEGAPR